ncbi:hypothetical protein M1M34_gp062 [Haloarcula tailed virus 2]|uniref:Uncharacterized protein n=1 Tax=Haloarcula tailed virus 2 TaxID=2877989 RepID=A0AAE8Y0P3_9CAUD|nr:hypothetical protein M1M34_gp062 [Haloarcula tailed virus 2]UBF23271.1 hypothetical protein HATV-2_gp120 [Haloarcula tailed virus 2]
MSLESRFLSYLTENEHNKTLSVAVPVLSAWLPVKVAMLKVLRMYESGIEDCASTLWMQK